MPCTSTELGNNGATQQVAISAMKVMIPPPCAIKYSNHYSDTKSNAHGYRMITTGLEIGMQHEDPHGTVLLYRIYLCHRIN